jgi:hypothetical protein
MKVNRIISLIFIGIFLISFASAICTVTFDKSDYVATETVDAAITCGHALEKNKDYSVNWTNSSGALVHQDNGTTPGTIGQLFYEDYTLPSGYLGTINATLSGDEMEGNDTANVTALGAGGNENILVITDSSFGGGYIGLVASIHATVKDENSKKISGGKCIISVWSNDESQMINSKEAFIVNGEVKVSAITSAERVEENTQYAYKIICYCGSAGGATECIDEDGNNVNNSVGSTKDFLETKTWLNVNTVVDKTNYEMKGDLFICANITNVNYTKRIPLHIFYQVKCSSGGDNDDNTDRALIIEDKLDDMSIRGISTNETQMQCKRFTIPESVHLQGRNSQCYASTNVWVVNDLNQEIFGYSTTSSVFNITSNELNLEPDWQLVNPTRINSIVNLSSSSFNDYNGTGIGNIDLKLHSEIGELDIIEALDLFNLISNVTVQNLTGNLIRHIDYELEYTEEDNIEIELYNVDLSKTSGVGWWNITLDFRNLELRQTEALEGIENKTGTFHLDVNCPSSGTIGSDMDCIITAYVEDSQTVQKEVDFTCYISDGITQYSSVNFNQMITQNAVSLSRTFAIPSTFNGGTQYVLQCHANYYNLGSRKDSFYDTFIASSPRGISGIGGERAPITGGVVDEKEKKDKDIRDIIAKFNPFSPKRNWAFIFIEIVVIAGIGILLLLAWKNRKKQKTHIKYKQSSLKRIFQTILILISIVAIIFAIFYLYNNIKVTNISSATIQGSLVKDLILIGFFVLMAIIIFKVFNIRGEIKFGNNYSTRKYNEDLKSTKLQQKMNQITLKDEIKRKKLKKDYKVRKMTPKEFAEFVKKKHLS